MRIEAIEATRSTTGKLRLRFGDGSSLMVYPAVIPEHRLYVGMELSQEELESIVRSAAQVATRERAVRIISATAVTEKELRHRLRQKGEQEEQADRAVDWLKDLNLLDDRRAAESVVFQGISKGYGEARLRQMLYEKGVPRELWQEVLAELPSPHEGIRAFLTKRFRGKVPDQQEQKRATDALLRRGHKWSDIRLVMEEFASESYDVEEYAYDD